MELGMIGLGRMGGNMVRRLLRAGHRCVCYDVDPAAIDVLAGEGAVGASSLTDLVDRLARPRTVWLMLPAALVDAEVTNLLELLDRDDVVVDGGNSHFPDDLRRAAEASSRGMHYIDVGASGGVFGLERGYCLMIGGDAAPVARLSAIFEALAPGSGAAPPTPGRDGAGSAADRGYLHCGGAGAGHFVKMVHNAIEYGMMAAYAEGLNLLHHAGAGRRPRDAGAETTPLPHPERYQYQFDVPEIVELWRRGSVITSWLLDLTARALHESPELADFAGTVSDSGEGRWSLMAAIDTAVPMPVLSSALFARFSSRGADDFANRVLSALRLQFGGHVERTRN